MNLSAKVDDTGTRGYGSIDIPRHLSRADELLLIISAIYEGVEGQNFFSLGPRVALKNFPIGIVTLLLLFFFSETFAAPNLSSTLREAPLVESLREAVIKMKTVADQGRRSGGKKTNFSYFPTATPSLFERDSRAFSHGCIRLEKPFPVQLFYRTAWVDRDGELNFREDIYRRDKITFQGRAVAE